MNKLQSVICGSILLGCLVLAAACSPALALPSRRAQAPPPSDTFPHTGVIEFCGINNFAWTIGNALARSAMPPANRWGCLKDYGFTTVINQHADDDDSVEKVIVQGLGMEYIGAYRIPDQTAYSPAMLQALMQDVVTRLQRGERILIHDAGGRGRMGFWEAAFMLWDGWSSREAIDRYIAFGWRIDCDKGGNGQMQAINELAAALGQPTYYPAQDSYGTPWANCPRPDYMAGWDYSTIQWPEGRNGLWTKTGVIPGRTTPLTPPPDASLTPAPTVHMTAVPTLSLTPPPSPVPTDAPSATWTPSPSPAPLTSTPSPGMPAQASPTATPRVTFPYSGVIEFCGINNFAWTIGNALARSAFPPENRLPCLKERGFTTIINQEVESDGTIEHYRQAVIAAGLEYVEGYQITDQTAYSPVKLEQMLNDVVTRLRRGERILVHDWGGRGRMGFWEAAFMLWDGWSSREAIDRYIAFGWRIDCDKGGNGQMQAINELAVALGQPTYYPAQDSYGTSWANCPRPDYMAGWNYATIRWPPGPGGLWTKTGVILPPAPPRAFLPRITRAAGVEQGNQNGR